VILTPSRFYVELDVFSGRRNSAWPLAAEESQELLARINRLSADGAARPAGLGYRGFSVYRSTTGRPQRWLHVGCGIVRIADHHHIRHYRDTEQIEEWLRQQAISRGYRALLGSAPQKEETC
jgi:hypothetical protein